MPLIKSADAPLFTGPGMTATGLAAPSRGSVENSAWRFTLDAGTPGHEHSVSREEIFIVLSGRAEVAMEGSTRVLNPGDALIVPAHTPFRLSAPGAEPFEAVAVLPVGAFAHSPGAEPIVPPWAR